MEFGIFLNGYIPGPAAHETELEHTMLMREAEYAIFADKHNWKYAWFGEHHCLTEYSHMSAPEVVMGYVAAQTDYIHLGVGHQQPLAPQGAPGALRRACRDARPLHQQPLRVGHRPRRRQPRARQLQHPGHVLDQGRVGRGRPRDPADVGAGRLLVRGRALHRARRRTTSSPSRTARVTRRSGWRAATRPRSPRPASSASAPSPSTSSRSSTCRAASTPTRKASPTAPSRIGQFKNDNVMITNAVICCETARRPARSRCATGRGYLVTMVNLYHDTMPKSPDAITWPSTPLSLTRPRRPATTTRCSTTSSRAATCCAARPTRCASRSPAGATSAWTSSCSACRSRACTTKRSSQCLELFGDKVIPEFDNDRTHSTDRYRADRAAEVRARSTTRCPTRRVADGHPRERARPALAADDAPVRPCRATPPPPRNGCSAKRSGCSRGAGSTR